VYVFVSVKSLVRICDVVCVLKCNSVCLLFLEFLQIKLYLWKGYLWSLEYTVRTVGAVITVKIDAYINRF